MINRGISISACAIFCLLLGFLTGVLFGPADIRSGFVRTAQGQEAASGKNQGSAAAMPPIHYPEFPISEGSIRLFHVALMVEDLDASVDFYINMLGFRLIRLQQLGPVDAAFITTGDGEPLIELMQLRSDAKGLEGIDFSHLGVFVDDVDRVYKETTEAGATWQTKPGRPGPGAPYNGMIIDPDGNKVEIMENPTGAECVSCHRGPHL